MPGLAVLAAPTSEKPAGLSQEALVAKLQVAGWDLSRAGLSKVEAGLRRVNDAEAWMLAKVLGAR